MYFHIGLTDFVRISQARQRGPALHVVPAKTVTATGPAQGSFEKLTALACHQEPDFMRQSIQRLFVLSHPSLPFVTHRQHATLQPQMDVAGDPCRRTIFHASVVGLCPAVQRCLLVAV